MNMKTKIKNCVFWVLGVSFLFLTGCSEEIYENHLHSEHKKNDNSISFNSFLNETNLKDFKNTKSFNSTNIEGAQGRLVASEFYIDTTRIFRNTAPNNKVTYSFRAFPLSGTVEPNSYYNIVYEKTGMQWNELIFLNKEKSFVRKGLEALITLRIESVLTKKEILERYLNVVQFGKDIFGVKQAAQFYFKKTPAQ